MNMLVQATYHIWVWQTKYFDATYFPVDFVWGVAQGSQTQQVLGSHSNRLWMMTH
jgi:hypothetical protein